MGIPLSSSVKREFLGKRIVQVRCLRCGIFSSTFEVGLCKVECAGKIAVMWQSIHPYPYRWTINAQDELLGELEAIVTGYCPFCTEVLREDDKEKSV